MAERILEAGGLAVGYGTSPIVSGIELAVLPGQICTLVGPNGAGKSTMLKSLTRQLSPMAGTILLAGKDLMSVDARDLARTMAILTTERVDPELMTCEDVVAMGRYPHTGRLGLLGPDDRRAITSAMELVRVAGLANEPFACVSDGQRQRVMLARAICQEPRILLLDEPTSYLDIRHKLEFLRVLRHLAHKRGVAVVMSLHELELARHVSDVVVCVAHGRIDRMGTPDDIFADGYVRHLYDVDDDAFDEIYPNLDNASGVALQDERYVSKGQQRLRRGITTGTCAALATSAAVRLLLTGQAPDRVRLVTPKGLPVEAEPACAEIVDGVASCGIVKDAGDDPDVTNGVLVVASVELVSTGITIDGGAGVGRVTKPGLDQPVGAAAINRVPRMMIEEQALTAADELGYDGGLKVIISIPEGERLAQQTFNPQLGVVGGLSVLGTSGIEEPMSEQALVDTIGLGLRQAREQGARDVLLVPGNYAKAFVRESLPELQGIPQVMFSNYLGDALDLCVQLGFEKVLVIGHIGKLVKLAGGIMNTHSKVADCRLELLCAHAAVCGAGAEVCNAILRSATTDAALEVLIAAELATPVMRSLIEAMQRHLDLRTRGTITVGAVVFSNQHGRLGATDAAHDILHSWNADKRDET